MKRYNSFVVPVGAGCLLIAGMVIINAPEDSAPASEPIQLVASQKPVPKKGTLADLHLADPQIIKLSDGSRMVYGHHQHETDYEAHLFRGGMDIPLVIAGSPDNMIAMAASANGAYLCIASFEKNKGRLNIFDRMGRPVSSFITDKLSDNDVTYHLTVVAISNDGTTAHVDGNAWHFKDNAWKPA